MSDHRNDHHDVDAVVVGAGFGGLYAAYKLRQAGLTVHGIERGADVGGTWYWNRYPGARCDIESLEYSYQFSDDLQQDWRWTERYAAQPEILAYARHVADRFELRPLFGFSTSVVSASFDEDTDRWLVDTQSESESESESGCDRRQWRARFLVLATGGVSRPYTPTLAGLERFGGRTVHTGAWPADGVDVDGKRVAIIGTGGSGVQALPILADRAASVSVLQRTPTYVIPARNRSADTDVERVVKADYQGFRQRTTELQFGFGAFFDQGDVAAMAVDADERERRYRQRWEDGGYSFLYTFGDLGTNPAAAETAAEFIRGEIRRIVDDPVVAEALCPAHVFGCRRIVIGTDYYESFNRPNVSLVDVAADPIVELTATGVRTEQSHIDADLIVFATGFEDQAASLRHLDLRGLGGVRLADRWQDRPLTYLGLCTAGFPNMFFVNGPGNPSITTNMIANIEHTVDWIVGCVDHAIDRGWTRVDVNPLAQNRWTAGVDARANGRLLHTCTSRYVGVTGAGQRYVFPFIGVPDYRSTLADVAARGYPGLVFDGRPTPRPGVVAPLVAAATSARTNSNSTRQTDPTI